MSTIPARADCPLCPACKIPAGSTVDPVMPVRLESCGDGRLHCLACGHAWVPSLAEWAQAKRADAANERAERRDELASARGRASRQLEEKFERAKLGRW